MLFCSVLIHSEWELLLATRSVECGIMYSLVSRLDVSASAVNDS